MTLREFVIRYRKLKRFFFISEFGVVRAAGDDPYPYLYCPITAVCYVKSRVRLSTGKYETAASTLRLSQITMGRIVNAADDPKSKDPLRAILIKDLPRLKRHQRFSEIVEVLK